MGVPAFCYANLLDTATTITASSEDADHPKENAYDWRTDDFWKPTSAALASLTLDMGSATAVDYWAIYAHNAHLAGSGFQLRGSTDNFGASDVLVDSVTPTTSAPIARTITSTSYRYWRIVVTASTSSPQVIAAIGMVALGERLDMEQGIRVGSRPPTFARTPDTMPNRAAQGAFVGMSVKRRGVTFSADFNVVTPAWLRSNWADFQDHFESKPFFYIWDPVNYPAEAIFCWVNGQANPPTYSAEKYLSISLPLTGFYL